MKVRALKKRAGFRLHRTILCRKWERASNDLVSGIAGELMGIGAQMGNSLREMARSLVATVGQEFIKGSLLINGSLLSGSTTANFATHAKHLSADLSWRARWPQM